VSAVRNQRLAGRRVLITGAASGIGQAAAELFVKEGARVALLDRGESEVRSVAAALGSLAVIADVTDSVAVRDAVQRAANGLSGIDGLVNAAGVAGGQTLAETDVAQWRHVLEVNLTGSMLVTQAALAFLEASNGATIVNVSSGIGLRPLAGQGAYAASKAGVLAWTKVLAQELAPGIRVNATCPGPTDTPLMRANVPQGTTLERMQTQYALRRLGSAAEQAQAILYLTGPESSFITGVSLAVDGGRTFH
jgi:NAD(P)-dependent dehydrogenase (short-subunit alcohol dehydrogenase family)